MEYEFLQKKSAQELFLLKSANTHHYNSWNRSLHLRVSLEWTSRQIPRRPIPLTWSDQLQLHLTLNKIGLDSMTFWESHELEQFQSMIVCPRLDAPQCSSSTRCQLCLTEVAAKRVLNLPSCGVPRCPQCCCSPPAEMLMAGLRPSSTFQVSTSKNMSDCRSCLYQLMIPILMVNYVYFDWFLLWKQKLIVKLTISCFFFCLNVLSWGNGCSFMLIRLLPTL